MAGMFRRFVYGLKRPSNEILGLTSTAEIDVRWSGQLSLPKSHKMPEIHYVEEPSHTAKKTNRETMTNEFLLARINYCVYFKSRQVLLITQTIWKVGMH